MKRDRVACPNCGHTPGDPSRWMAAHHAARVLGINPYQMKRLVDTGVVGSLAIPGVKTPRIEAADVTWLIESGFRRSKIKDLVWQANQDRKQKTEVEACVAAIEQQIAAIRQEMR